ncbi:hypothetical protein LTR64_006463 [Lithohypha guttulata]|uniref:GAT domain-containing protein n=1 Tax=Lithohypha guttulata TaxID=1690604 RepID=A0AAN7TIW4_9EURO|nr:hypothetical protein LTR51_004980 [Lithohypha guttulata]KAK5091586.1 hypothetical protein LTR05_001771 [Lithohypha guttulata]
MKKFIGSIKRNTTNARSKSNDRHNGAPVVQSLPQGDHPEAVVVRESIAFCEAGAPGSQSAGDEYLHLPAIVDACESSPSAAREAAMTVQRYLSKQNFDRGYAQYNAIMLMRILTDNPGRNFTQNFDKNFNSTLKTLLRECRDSSVQQITRETLDYFEVEKLNGNETLMALMEMWRKEKGSSARMYSSSVGMDGTAVISHDFTHNDQGRSHSQPYTNNHRESRPPRGLPPADELAARIEEARTSARLLVQMCQSTPPQELIGNELIKEFAERARQANKSIQQYMACENPSPDEHTMLTLIETSEQLSISMTKHQRAMLQARKATGQASPSPQPQSNQQDPFSTSTLQSALPPQQPPRPQQAMYQPPQQQPAYQQSPYQQPPHQRQFNTRYESEDLYNTNSPGGLVSPIDHNEHSYMPPSGPPPAAIAARRQENEPQPYQTRPESPISPQRQTRHMRSESAAKDYDVSENPFADDNAYAAPAHPPPSAQTQTQPLPQQQQNTRDSYSLFNRAAGQLRDPSSPSTTRNTHSHTNAPSSTPPPVSELDSGSYPAPAPASHGHRDNIQDRPGLHGYNSGWQPTPSFMGRQASSEAHITMSGGSGDRR